jgi:hypothetical protein
MSFSRHSSASLLRFAGMSARSNPAGAVGAVEVRLHRHEIDDALEVLLLTDRELDGDDVLAELLLQRVERARGTMSARGRAC